MKQQQYKGFGLVLIIVLFVLVITTFAGRNNDTLSMQEFYQALDAGNFEAVWIRPNEATPTGRVELYYGGGGTSSVYVSDVTEIEEELKARDIDYRLFDVPQENYVLSIFLPIVLSAVIIMVLFNFMNMRAASGGSNAKMMNFGKSRARMTRDNKVNFEMVAGLDEEKEELAEVVDFLKPALRKVPGARRGSACGNTIPQPRAAQ